MLAKTAYCRDSFEDFVLDPYKWVKVSGTVYVRDGNLFLRPTLTEALLRSTDQFDLTESELNVQIALPDAGGGTRLVQVGVYLDATNRLEFEWNGTQLKANYILGGTPTGIFTLTFDPVLHAWWRMREVAGIIYFDASANGFDWTQLGSVAAPFALSAVTVRVSAKTTGNEAPSSVLIAGINIMPVRFGRELYESLAPLAVGDAERGYPLLAFCRTLSIPFNQLERYVRATDDGKPGWSSLVDVDRIESSGLEWLAQWAGVTLPGGIDDTEKRERIKEAGNRKRGTLESFILAARRYLTGNKDVLFKERDGGAYRLTVLTYAAETPDAARVLEALLTQKPAGIVLDHEVISGLTYIGLRVAETDYLDVENSYSNYFDVRT